MPLSGKDKDDKVETRAFTKSFYRGNNISQIAHIVSAGIAGAENAKRGLYLLESGP